MVGSKMTLRNTYYMLHRNNWPHFRTWSKQSKKTKAHHKGNRQVDLFLRALGQVRVSQFSE
jgi:hypothetical protein